MDKFTAKELQVGQIVALVDNKQRTNMNNHWYPDSYFKSGEVGRVIAPISALSPHLTLDVLCAGKSARRYVENASALFRIQKEEAFFNKKALAEVYKVPLLGTGQEHSIGSDPEIFAVDENGTVIPAWTFLKKKPVKPDSRYQYTFWDGAQAEFTVRPAPCHEQVIYSIRTGLASVYASARAYNSKARLVPTTVLDIPQEVMANAKEEHIALGCAPSLNAYPDVLPINVPDARELPFRFSGCHIHMGYAGIGGENAIRVVKAIDAIFGVISIAMFQGMEDARRRRFYGRAGEYRLPAHGLEYRVPSSALLAHPVATHVAFDLARAAAQLGWRGLAGRLWETKGEDQVRHIINDYDVDEARAVVKKNDELLTNIFRCMYAYRESYNTGAYSRMLKFARALVYEGVKENLPIDDMAASWMLVTPTSSWPKSNLYLWIYGDK